MVGYWPPGSWRRRIAVGSAATQTIRPGAADDFRAAYVTSQDIAEGKRVADTSCTRCHGSIGISTAKRVPHLAGQRAVYLHLELQAYKSGARGKGMMADATKFLSEDALIKVAAWYSVLDPPQPTPAASTREVASGPDPVGAGQAAAASCAGCHGEAGISKTPGMPNLVGQDPKYLAAATAAYQNGRRKHEMMKALVATLSQADVGSIAQFYASQEPGRARTPAAGNRAAGKAASAACVRVPWSRRRQHGSDAEPRRPRCAIFRRGHARLQGRFARGSRDEGTRDCDGDSALGDLAAYYASLQPQAPRLVRPLGTADWAERCDRCHGVNGNSTDPRVPALAAQRADYLERTLNAVSDW